jgi:hypothetical protein
VLLLIYSDAGFSGSGCVGGSAGGSGSIGGTFGSSAMYPIVLDAGDFSQKVGPDSTWFTVVHRRIIERMNRRSFLACVAAAIGAPLLPKDATAEVVPSLLDNLPPSWPFHYWIWDSAVVRPGEVIDEQLFPPPAPLNFMIHSIGCRIKCEAHTEDLLATATGVSFEVKAGGADGLPFWAGMPLYMLVQGQLNRLPVPIHAKAEDDLYLRLYSDGKPVSCVERVTVSIILQGIVRREDLV